MNGSAGAPKKDWSEEELEALPDDGFLHEVVNGELVMSPKNNFQHEQICLRLAFALESFNRRHKLGIVLGSSAGFWMHNRNCRAPDVSFIPRGRLEWLGFSPLEGRFFPGAPDLAVEVLSPNTPRAEMDAQLADFFASGTRIAWIIDPDTQSVEVCRSMAQRKRLGNGEHLDGEDLLPGFRHPISSLFTEWGWD